MPLARSPCCGCGVRSSLHRQMRKEMVSTEKIGFRCELANVGNWQRSPAPVALL